MNMIRKKYGLAAITTAVLMIVIVALTLVLGDTVGNIVSGGNGQSVYAAEISVDEGYVANGNVAQGYDPLANVPEGYTAQAISSVTGWNAYIAGKETVNKYFYLTEDITIENLDKVTEFKGILDGNGHTVEVKVEATLTTADGADQTVGGLFKLIDGGTVKNVRIKVTKYAVGADQVGTLAGIIAGQSKNNAKIENVRIDLDYGSAESMDKADSNNRNVTYLYDYNSRSSGAPNYLILGGVVGDIAGDTAIDETTVSVNSNAGNENLSETTTAGFGISGWRGKDDADRYYILGGFVGRVNSGFLTMTNVNLEGSGKIYNFNESADGGGWFEKSRNNYGYAGGFVGEVGGNGGGKLSINGLNYLFTGVLEKTNMNKSNATGAIVGTGGTDSSKTTVQNVYYASSSTQREKWVMGDNETYNGGIAYDISAPVYVSGGKLVIPAQQSTVWTEGKDALYSVTDRDDNVYNVESYMIVADGSQTGSVYLSMDMFANVGFTAEGNQQDYGKLYTLNYYTMGSADIADGFEYNAEANTYSHSKTYDGIGNKKDISVYMTAGEKVKAVNAFSGEKANSGAAGDYSFTLNKELYAASGVTEVDLTNVEGKYLVDAASGMICSMNVADGAKIDISIAKLAVSISFDNAGNITYGDSSDTVKTNNPVSIISAGGVEGGVTPDEFTGYTLTGYTEKTAAGTEVTLGISEVVMNGAESNYEFTLGEVTATVKKYEITGALDKDKFTTTEVEEGATAVFVPDTELPDELVFVYEYSLSAEGDDWTTEMPVESDRYYVRVSFDNGNYNLATNVYTFTITAVVKAVTTDKVVDGVFTTEYFNTAAGLVNALRDAVDYEAEVKEETDYFVFTIDGAEIQNALDVSETEYNVTATLKSQRYEDASVEFKVKVVTRKISVSGEVPNASWSELANGVYDGQNKEFSLVTEDAFDKTYTITYSATEDGEYTAADALKNAGYYKVTAVSADANYEITEGNGTYFVEKATPKVDFSGLDLTISYGAAAVTGDTTPVISGVYDANTYTVSTLTEGGEAYVAAAVNAGGKVIITTSDFVITENAQNYNEPEITAKEVIVDKAAISVATVDKNITYGDEIGYVATDFYGEIIGLVGEDSLTAEYMTDYVVKTPAGTTCEVVLTFTFANGNADNYIINNGEPVTAGLTVTKRLINGTMVAPDSVYDGKPYDQAYIDSESIIEGDVVNCTVQYSLDNVSYVPNAPVDAGTYYIGITSVDNPNYEMGTIAGGVQFTIGKAAAPVINLSLREGLVYDGNVKNISDVIDVTVRGLFEGDESLAGQVQTVCLSKMLDAGDYTVSAYLRGLANYEDAADAEITVTIAKADVEVELKDNSVIYGDPLSGNEVYFVSASGLIGSDKFTMTGYEYLSEYVPGQTAAGASIEVEILYTLDNEANYNVNGGEKLVARLNVQKRVLDGTIGAADKKYDGTAYNGATAEWNNLVGEDTVSVTFEYSSDGRNFTAEAPVHAGTYYVRAAATEDNGNYSVNPLETAKFTITKADAPVINATVKDVVYSGQIFNPADTVEYTVNGLVGADAQLAANVRIYCTETILGAGEYTVGLVLNGLKDYEDAETVTVVLTVARADREISATARMGYGYVDVNVNERNTVEYSLDNVSWNALPSDGRISVEVSGIVSVYLRYKQTDNYNQSEAVKVDANITYDVLEEYVGRNYADTEVSFANAKEIATVLGWQESATGEKSDTYEVVVGGLQEKYDSLMSSAKDTVVAALNAGANMSGYQKLAATVISVSVGGLSLAVGALAIKRRKGGYKNEK